MRMITHSYDTYEQAVRVVNSLEAAGIPHDDISIVSGDKDRSPASTPVVAEDAAGTGTGATIGTVLGGGAGLLAGLGALAIPGVGPVVAAGWLIATLTGAGVGAAAGGLVGSLANSGVDETDATHYADHVGQGGTLVTVRASDNQAADAEYILEHGELRLGAPVVSGDSAFGTGMTTAGLAADPATLRASDPLVAPAAAMPVAPVVAPMPMSTMTDADRVRLREEQLAGDRRPANRPLSGYAADEFRDRPTGTGSVRDNAATRAVDRTLDTNLSGENPKV